MANATQTIAGDVQLAGDLAGNNNAASPALVDTGVTPGAYAVASITVDSKGRLTLAGNSTGGQVMAIVPNATTTSKGAVQIGSGLSVTDGLVSLNAPDATYTTKGVVQIDSNTLIINSGVLSLPVASASQAGGIKIGANLVMNAGVLSIPTASASVLGVVKIGTGLTIDGSGFVSTTSFADATYSTKGIVQIDNGSLVVTSGVLSVPVATGSVRGTVKTGTNISNTGGLISVADATNSVKGVVNSANSANISISAGSINTGSNVPLLNTTNLFTKSVNTTLTTLTDAATIAVDASLSNVYTVTLGGNRTLANPINLLPGRYTFIIKQDATGSRTLSFGSAYKFTGGVSTLSTTANSIDTIMCVSNGTDLFCTLNKAYV